MIDYMCLCVFVCVLCCGNGCMFCVGFPAWVFSCLLMYELCSIYHKQNMGGEHTALGGSMTNVTAVFNLA